MPFDFTIIDSIEFLITFVSCCLIFGYAITFLS